MLISFTCPHCGVTKQVLKDFVGRSGPCASCGVQVTIHPNGTSIEEFSPRPVIASRERLKADRVTRWMLIVFMVMAVVSLIVGGFAVWRKADSLAGPAISPRAQMRRASCENRMRQIAVALRAYHDKHLTYPPAYTTDAAGNKLHSWRTLILPFMGRENLYQRIALDEPWDSPRNLVVGEFLPEFHCDAEVQPPSSKTSYVAVVGPGSVWDPQSPVKRADITDKKSQTLLIVEWHDSDIRWMEPRDLSVEEFVAQGGRSHHPFGDKAPPAADDPHVFLAAFADEHVETLADNQPAETRRAYVTRAGGEKLPEPVDKKQKTTTDVKSAAKPEDDDE